MIKKLLNFDVDVLNSYDGLPMIFIMKCTHSKLLFYFYEEVMDDLSVYYYATDINDNQIKELLANNISFTQIFNKDFWLMQFDWDLSKLIKISFCDESQRENIADLTLNYKE